MDIAPIIIEYAPIAVSTAAVAAAMLPPAKPGSAWGVVRGLIDFAACNFGQAKNASSAEQKFSRRQGA